MSVELSTRAIKTTENLFQIRRMEAIADHLAVEISNKAYGVSSHERLHLMDALKRFRERCAAIMAEEVPAP